MRTKIYNKIITLTVLISVIFSMIGIGIKETYALETGLDSKEYTRKELQEMVVSTALSLYYNSYFSDYGQRAMDALGVTGNYFNYGNFLWRDLNVTPESVGYSKYYHIDCSGYNFLIYKNTIGYDLSEYNTVNRYMIFNKEYEEAGEVYPIRRVSYFKGQQRLEKYREAYSKFGYGWNSMFLSNVFRKAAGNCKLSTDCRELAPSDSTEPFIYNNIDGHDENEVVYYFEARGPVSLEEVKEKYAIAEAALQPGDIISYTKYDKSENEESGHVMFFAGDDVTTSSKGEKGFTNLLLHSTGNGGGDYTDSPTSVNNKLYKKNSIIDSPASTFIDGADGKFENAYGSKPDGSGDYITRFGIIRPLNTVCEKGTDGKYNQSDKCKINNNSFNVQLTDTQLNNNEARVALKKTQVQQYMILEKEYNNQTKVTSSEENGYTRNIISEYNSVNVGDNIVFKLRLRNKFDQTEVSGIRLEAIIPDNATYVANSCSDSCKKEGNKLIWENISISGENKNNDITFNIKTNTEGTVVFAGYSVTKDNKTLQMDPRTIYVQPTQNGINKEILRKTVEEFKTLVENGQINYINSSTHTENTTSFADLKSDPTKTISTSTLGYVKLIYYNAFGFDLDELIGTESILNNARIKNAIFEEVPYPTNNNMLTGTPEIPEEEKTPKVFAKKTAADYEALSSVQKKISQMLVPGLYGGKHLKGNDNNDRTKFLRSFYNNQAYQSDLEVGDIIVIFSSDTTSLRAFLYLGDDGENGAILTRFTISTSDKPLFLYHTDQYLDTYYNDEELQKKTINKPSSQILNEMFAKDLFVVLRPSRIATTVEYDYNGGIQGPKSYVAYTKYTNLVQPKKADKTLTLTNERDNSPDRIYTGTSTFDCWTSDLKLEKCITNDTKLVSKDYHKVYAKWNDTTITLPKLTSTGYTHTAWSNSSITVEPNKTYAIEKNQTLNAVWEANKYTVKFNSNGGTGTVNSQEATYDTEFVLNKNEYTRAGYQFNGWNTKADGSGTSYKNNATVINLVPSGTITLYAQWKPNTYTVNFDSNTGTGTMESIQYTYDTTETLPGNTFIKQNYKFNSWNTKADGSGTKYTNEASVKNLTTSGTITLYAQWTGNSYTIKFNSNTGTGSMSNQTTTYDKETTLKTNLFTKTGYTFTGWNTAQNGTGDSYNNEQVVKNLVTSGTITLYAQWQANEYTVAFNNNNGTGTMEDQVFTYNKSEKITVNTFTKEGYTFDVWNTKADGSGTSYADKAYVKNLAPSGNITLYAMWKANTYTVTFNSNTGEGTMTDQTLTYDVETALTENTFTKTGYTFDGWNTKADGSGTSYANNASVKKLAISGTITLYAKWKANTYKVTFNSNTGEGTMSEQTITYDVETALTENTFTKEGYSFVSWNTKEDGTGTDYANKALVKNLKTSGNITLYAKWQANTYTVTFDNNTGEGTMSSQTFTYDKESTLTENSFTKIGYTFVNWNTKADGSGTTYSNKAEIKNIATSGNVTLYAIWKANTYKITFNSNTGTGTMSEQSVEYNKDITLSANEFTKTGYTFDGWNTKADGSGTTYQDKQAIKNLVPSGTITLYAMWIKNYYTVVFDNNTGEGTMTNQRITYEEEVALTENSFEKVGYTFVNWNTKADGSGTTYANKAVVKNLKESGNITLYAMWKANTYAVTFNSNTGEGTMPDQTFTYDKESELTENTFTKTGYTFDGWSTQADGKGTSYADKASVKNLAPSGTTTLYAKWKPNTYKVAFQSNTGEGTMSYQTITYDIETALKENAFTKTGYTFVNWNTKADGSGTAYTNKEVVKNLKTSGSVTLYAQWKANDYTVTFDSNTGTGIMPAQTLTYDKKTTLTQNAFTKTGYTFLNWNTKADGSGTSYTDKAEVKNIAASGNITLYAIWQANSYKISYNNTTGEGTMSTQNATYDKDVTLLENEFTKQGYIFDGWNTKEDGTGTTYQDKQTVKNLVPSGNITLYAMWVKNYYTVVFDNNTGTGKMVNQRITYDEEALLTENLFQKEGYTFVYWNTKADGSGTTYQNKAVVKNLKESGNITLYAIWKANTYTVTFNSNTGEGTMTEQTFTYDKETALTENTFTKTGYTFDGWNTQADGKGTTYANKKEVKNLVPSGNITLYAKWKANTYKVAFQSNTGEGTMSDQPITYDTETALTENTFTKEGYSFVSWNTKEDGTGTNYTNKALVKNLKTSGTITLYAIWKANDYTITFDGNTGTGTMPAQTLTYDKKTNLTTNSFEKVGYTFVNWNTKADGSGTTYTNEAEVKNIASSGNVTLYAIWQANKYKITFNSNTGTGTMSVQPVVYDKEMALLENEFKKTGYTFIGWNTKEDGTGTTYEDKQTVKNLTTSDTITLYAMWSINKYTITFDSNGGEGTMSNIELTYDEEKKLPQNTYTKENYKFISWNTKKDGSGTTYEDEQTIKNVASKGTVTLYAIWKTTLNYNVKEYKVDDQNKFIDNIPVNTSLENYLKNIEVGEDYTVKVELNDKELIATGSTTKILKGDKVIIEFVNIVRGDVNKDGKISALDYVKIKNHIMKSSIINEEDMLLAADANLDNGISALDYVRIKNIILQTS